ncbi:SDR family oxidoreductase, partial [Hyella patelloides]|uniref:SDR family oxidoreductase n=1 Tax=Hyella patelloides TaxID=1982969 RepID=UPI0011AA0AD1
ASVRHPQEELSDVAFLLNSLGHLWLAGIEVDWSRFYIQEERDRVPLPTYPFQRQRYWIETTEKETRKSSKPQKSSTKIVELLNKADTSTLAQKLEQSANFTAQQQKLLPEILEILVKQHRQELNVATIEDWLYQFQWKPIKHNPTKTKIQPSKWIFFADRTGVAEKIAHQLQLLGCECILVYRGDHYQKLKIDTYQLNPTDSVEFEQLIVEIQSKSELPLQKVIHLWSLDTPATEDLTLSSLESAQLWGCGTVLHIVQALIKTNNLPQLWLVTRATQSVCSKTEKVSVAASPLWGMGRVLSLEYPQMRGVLVDLDPRTPESETETLLKLITDKELEEDHLAVREAQTYVARLVKQSLQPSPSVSLESDAIYLITGGLGALGLHTAKWMVEKGAQNLILIGRTQPSQEKQALINDLQQKGASVVVVQADVSNAEDFSKVFQQIDSSMLPLKGVVHAAGVAGFKPMLQMELIQLEEVMAPKVKGGWILHQLTKDKELDFFVSFSSFSAVCGGVGDAHYGASNQFLDALTHYRQAKGLPSFSINWGPWSGGGMASKQNLNLMIKIGIEPLTPEQGITALEQLWTSDHPQTIVANVNWGLFKQLQLYEIGRQRLLLEEIEVELLEIQSSTIEPKIKILEEIEAASENELQDILLAYVQLEMSKLLGLNSSQLLEVDLSLV